MKHKQDKLLFTDKINLPKSLPIFPLNGALLLPHGKLPLQVFEPRYRKMVNDTLATNHRLLGIIQPAQQTDDNLGLQRIGCAGRIVSFTEQDDDIYLILLAGHCRFTIKRELKGKNGYRIVVPDWQDYQDDLRSAETDTDFVNRNELKRHLKRYLSKKGMTANWEIFSSVPDTMLITSLAMLCPFDAPEKQALLETKPKAKLATKLISILRHLSSGKDKQVSPTVH